AQAAPALLSGHAQSDPSYTGRLLAPDAVSQPGQQQPASDRDSDGHPNDGCAICAVMALANAVLFATPPVLLLPQAVEFLYLTTDAEFVHLNSTRVAFQPRAPPISSHRLIEDPDGVAASCAADLAGIHRNRSV